MCRWKFSINHNNSPHIGKFGVSGGDQAGQGQTREAISEKWNSPAREEAEGSSSQQTRMASCGPMCSHGRGLNQGQRSRSTTTTTTTTVTTTTTLESYQVCEVAENDGIWCVETAAIMNICVRCSLGDGDISRCQRVTKLTGANTLLLQESQQLYRGPVCPGA